MRPQSFIGFCGTLYPFLSPYIRYGITRIAFDVESFDKIVEEFFPKEESYYYGKSNKSRGNISKRKSYEIWFGNIIKSDEYFIKYQAPVFITNADKDEITINCKLSTYEFYKKFDTNQTFQEISMYLGSILAKPEKPMPVLDNNTMRDIKGFDKFSFRKPKC